MKKTTKCYLISLAVVLSVSAYPIYMGIVVLSKYISYGYILVENYPKYIIPYAPLCAALIVSTALTPLLFRLSRRRAILIALAVGIAVFLALEIGFEQIKVVEGYTYPPVEESEALPLESWQYLLCVATPQVLRAIGEPIYAQNNPAFKVHFYVIALIILLASLNVVYGFYRMARTGDAKKKKPLITQLISLTVFVSLCVLACFTAFWRNGTLNVSPLSAVCMIVFFVVFGLTAGVFAGSFLYGKRRVLSCAVPAIVAGLVTLVMYVGELMLTGGELFRFGDGFFFSAMGGVIFAPVDVLTILISGALTYLIMRLIGGRAAAE